MFLTTTKIYKEENTDDHLLMQSYLLVKAKCAENCGNDPNASIVKELCECRDYQKKLFFLTNMKLTLF